jgi:hypothetical protein
MTIHHLPATDETARKLAAVAFPSYTGRTYKLSVHDAGGMSLASYWSEGSRSYYAVLRLADMAVVSIPQNGSGFDGFGRGIEIALPTALPAPGFAVVEHSIFCGKDSGITIHVQAENAAPLLPATTELTRAERIVLVATRSLKSSYGGIKEFRFHQAHSDTGISREDWDAAKASLISRRLLNAAGAITPEGKNAVGTTALWNLRVGA